MSIILDDVVIARDKWGISYFVHHASHVGHALLTKMECEASILRLAKQELEGTLEPTILDVGANAGTFSLPLSEMAGNVYLVEADPDLIDLLDSSIQHNGLRNTTLIHAAISQTNDDNASFYRAKHLKDLSSMRKTYVEGRDDYEMINVPAKRLDALMESEKIGQVDLLKIDIEGMSSEAIHSLGSHMEDIRTIIAEPDDDIDGTSRLLEDRGFSVSRPLSDRHDLPRHTRETIVFSRV